MPVLEPITTPVRGRPGNPEPRLVESVRHVDLWHGDALDVLRAMPDQCLHAVVCDPPYALNFMGRSWDDFSGFVVRNGSSRAVGDDGGRHDEGYRNMRGREHEFQTWCQEWATECLRVLMPGGHLLAFGGTRTYHRLTCGIEDAGFEIRDSITWLYASGFPKSLDVSKAIDAAAATRPATTDEAARWSGWGTALKPASEPIVVARKPLAGTVAGNVLTHGTGALNIDATRVRHASAADLAESQNKNRHATFGSGPRENRIFGADTRDRGESGDYDGAAGRWPSNFVLSHAAACGSDEDPGECVPGCPVRELDEQSGDRPGMRSGVLRRGSTTGTSIGGNGTYSTGSYHDAGLLGYDDVGGASRFFPCFRYEAKPASSERPEAGGVLHPTVKPTGLMRFLARLVTPPGGTVLDLFAGSGTTGEACMLEGFSAVLIEREGVYIPLIQQRIARARLTPPSGRKVVVPARRGAPATGAAAGHYDLFADIDLEGTP